MEPEWIQIDNNSSRGKRAFRGFLEYAKTGRLPSLPTSVGGETDSPFEDFVLKALRDKGYSVATQVGVNGYFIDLAVRHPEIPGKFVLGIECDGRMYHSGKSARDRDRLRQDNLERQGWSIYRIWSTDWFADPAREVSRLDHVIRTKIQSENRANETSMESNVNLIAKSESIVSAKPEAGYAKEPPVDIEVNPDICKKVVAWNNIAKRMTNIYEKDGMNAVSSAMYYFGMGTYPPSGIVAKVKKALRRAIELKFDPNKQY